MKRPIEPAQPTFLGFDAVSLQLPKPDLVLYGHREQGPLWVMERSSAAAFSWMYVAYVLAHLWVRIGGKIVDDLLIERL
jgi:hypothetical protein